MPPLQSNQAKPTLATTLSDPVRLQQWIQENPGSNRIRTFLFHRSQIKTEYLCDVCERDIADSTLVVKVNDRELLDGADNFIWCITCDGLEHLSCNQVTQLSDQQAPWICATCKENPNNESAVDLVTAKKVGQLLDRRLLSIKAAPVDQFQYEELMNFFVKSLNIDFINGVPDLQQLKERFEEQKRQADELGYKFNEASDKITNLVASLEAQADELAHLRQESSKRNSESEPSAHKSSSSSNPSRAPFITYASDFGLHAGPAAASTKERKKPNFSDQSPLDKTIEVIEKLELNQLRQVLPIIKEFNGDYSKWQSFERQVRLVQSEGEYSGQFMKYIIRDKLSGTAADLVDGLLDTLDWEDIMDHLRNAFGNPSLVVDAKRKQVQKIRLPNKLTHAAVVEARTIIASYIQACRQAKIQSHDRSLALAIYSQLDARYCEGYYAYFKLHHPFETREEKLDVLIEYFDSIRDTLPPGTYSNFGKDTKPNANNSFQLTSISTGDTQSSTTSSTQQNASRSSNQRSRTENYEIRSFKDAKYMGYDIEKLKNYPARCLLCGRDGHYTVECRAYKKKTLEERLKWVESKRLCQSCIITTDHQANQCPLKKYCGARIGTNRCTTKHHVSLHPQNSSRNRRYRNGFSRNKPENNNTSSEPPKNKSVETSTLSAYHGHPVNSTQGNNSVLFTDLPADGYLLLTLGHDSTTNVESSPRTIKLFRTLIEHRGKRAAAFAVGDSAAEITLVKRSLVDALGITGPPAVIGIQWTDDSSKNIIGIKVDIPIKGILPDSKEFLIKDCYAVDDFNLPPRSLNVEQLKRNYPHLASIPFESYKNAVPAVLLGARHASLVEALTLWEDGEGKPIGVLTKLGYSIYGLSSNDPQLDVLSAIATEIDSDDEFITNEQLSKLIEASASLESLQLKPPGTQLTVNEKSAIEQAETGIKQLSSGRIQMPLIWRLVDGEKPKLPDNFPMVLKRQLAQERKLSKNPELLEAFNNNFKSEIDDGYIRGATIEDIHTTQNVNYVPMSLVVNANKRPIKTRNVYDASAKFKGTSLNENLLPGPNLLIDLLKPLMSMRECSIAFTGDIKSMFNQISIDPADQNSQRILWRADTSQPMQIFIKQSMMFGPTSSPFVSQFVKNWIADQFHSKYPDTAKSIKSEVYMDDWFTSAPSLDTAIKRAREGIDIFTAAHMQLVGIQSNSPELLQALPPAHIKKELIPLITDIQTSYVSKVLGVNWNTATDKLVFELNESLLQDKYLTTGKKPTKREQCSLIARIFDVLGLLAHCIIRARIILQHAWKNKIDWDIEVTDKDAKLWSEWLIDLRKAATIEIPRQRSSLNTLSKAKTLELHTFSDAGQEAIAAVSYMVVVHNGKRESSFVLAKAKVAPLKLKSKQEITEMPRLELLAALIGARLATHISTLHSHLSLKKFFWCDSNVVLHWIWNGNIKLPRFAISPISEILELTESKQWKYIDTKLNVADLATKFQSFDFSDSSSVWFTGPSFLTQEPIHWPTQTFADEKKEQVIVCIHQLAELSRNSHDNIKENPFEFLPKRLPPYECALLSLTDKATGEIKHSAIMEQLKDRKPTIYFTWSKLVRATARMLLVRNEVIIPLLRAKKWRHRIKRKQILSNAQPKAPVSSEYMELAELFLIRFMQRQIWSVEIEALQKGHRINNKKLLELSVFLDNDQILRIHSRVALPFNEYPQKYAPLVPRLPGKNSLSEIMLTFYHNMHRHICIESQIAEFRSKYWMIALRERLNSIRHHCNCCKLWLATQSHPYMADLPIYRVDRKLKPFEVTGLDCCGPFTVVFEEEERKVWILMFTCTVTRFIHAEILLNIDTKSTLTAILSTYAAHGPMVRLISDQGTNFIGASNLINREQAKVLDKLKEMQEGVNRHFISQLKDFRWTFLPVKAAWFGGFYERLIGEIKRGLREEIKAKGIELQAFKIAMYETVHRLNNRPLTHIPISHEEEEVLTPHMLAKNRPGWPYLPSAHTLKSAGKPIEDRSYYVEGQKLADRITRRFYKHYLTELTRRTKWNRAQPPLNIGDLVLIIDPNETRQKWVRGEIVSFRPSGDSIPRVAEVRTKKGIKEFTIQHLAKIDILRA